MGPVAPAATIETKVLLCSTRSRCHTRSSRNGNVGRGWMREEEEEVKEEEEEGKQHHTFRMKCSHQRE